MSDIMFGQICDDHAAKAELRTEILRLREERDAAIRANHLAFVEVSTAAYRLLDEIGRSLCEPGLDPGTIDAYDALARLVNHDPWVIR